MKIERLKTPIWLELRLKPSKDMVPLLKSILFPTLVWVLLISNQSAFSIFCSYSLFRCAKN